MMNYFSYNKKGFTLIETLIALLIFATAVTAMMVITSHGVTDMTLVKNKYVANYLAEEGIEIVRYVRDDLYVKGQPFLPNFTDTISSCANGCNADPILLFENQGRLNDVFLECNPIDNCRVRLDASGYYRGSLTFTEVVPFTRVITVDTDGVASEQSEHELHVKSVVTWQEGLVAHSVSSEEHLFDWFTVVE
jgi:prepilin-type N-terminal cleavage/methylation domain-containing protein